MLWEPAAPHLPLGRLEPPYTAIEPVVKLDTLAAESLPNGVLLVLDVTCSAEDWLILPDVIPCVRIRVPAAPLILRVHEVTPDAVRFARRVEKLGVRAIVSADEPIYGTLRAILTDPEHLADQVIGWLPLCGIRLSSNLSSLIKQIFKRAPQYATLSKLLDETHESATTARWRLRKKRLPPPHCWHQVFRALHTALKIQADPDTPFLKLAMSLGYHDHSALSRQINRNFGLNPGDIRGTLGWEWLLERWLRKQMPKVKGRNGRD